MPPDKQKKKLAALVAMIENFDAEPVIKQHFEETAKALLQYVARMKEENRATLEAAQGALREEIAVLRSRLEAETQGSTETIIAKAEDTLNSIRFEHEALIAEAEKKLDAVSDGLDGLDGKDADEEAIAQKVLARIPSPLVPSLDGVEQKIQKLEERISSTRTAPFIGPSRGFFMFVEGNKQGLKSTIDFTGPGVTATKGGLDIRPITVSATAPADPYLNQLWVDIS